MKNQGYILKVETPCNQNWRTMKINESGKFCNQCSKSVVNFAHLSDKEIVTFFDGNNGNVCGRFANDQLNRIIKVEKKSYLKIPNILSGLLLLGTTQNVNATEIYKLKDSIEIVESNKFADTIENREINQNQNSDSLKNVIKGTVLDVESKEPLFGVKVYIEGIKIGTHTNLDGDFTLNIPDSLLKDDMKLVFTYYEFETFTLFFNRNQLPINNDFYLTPQNYEQEITIGIVVSMNPRKKWQFWKRR